MLNGEWRLIYTTNSGSSAGKIGPLVGIVSQRVDLKNFAYVNVVDLLPGVRAELLATWENDAFGYDTLWTVVFKKLVFKLFGIGVIQKELKQKGFWRMSFLDETLRILHAKGSKNAEENVYVMVKK